MRITGLASGMDTETMIKDMMKAQRMPLDRIFQRKQYMEWQRDDFRAANRKLFDFRNLISDSAMRQGTYIQKIVSSSSPEDISVRNINSTSDFSGKINVDQLAESATMQSKTAVIASEADLTKVLNTTVPSSFIIKAIKADGTLDSTGYEVKLTSTSTMQSVLDDINKNSGVTAVYDSFTGKLAFTAKNSGDVKTATTDGNEIEFSGNYGFLQVEQNNLLAADITSSSGTVGKNAVFTYNGLTTERQSNTFQINGYEINLKKASKTDISFSSSPDTDKILESVTKFIDEYNKLIENLNGEVREKKYRDFQPLTTEQKKDLEEKEIELWDEKAKSGTLRNDSLLTGVLGQMRTILNSAVTSTNGNIRLSDLGISTTSNYADNGKLVINESKLKEAISADPNKIYELFSATSNIESEKGLGVRLQETLDATRKKIIAKAGSDSAVSNSFSLGRMLNGYESQMTRFEDRLQMVENRYYRQFGAMEAAIQRANQQSAYLMNSFGGGQ
ncbi:MAG: flagellar hook-associated protein 2 [Paenisporosarcina sp.]